MRPASALLILELDSLGEAYQVVQSLSAAEVVELVPSASGAVLLLSGSNESLAGIRQQTSCPHSRLIERLPDSVAQAYLGFENPALDAVLLCFESNHVGEVFEAAIRMEAAGWTAFDVRILRGGPLRAYVLATGQGASPVLTGLQGSLTRIENPSPALKEFFEIKAH